MVMRSIVFLTSLLLLACNTVVVNNEDSPFYSIPVGSKLVLHQTVTVPASRASLYIQGGRIAPYSDINQYHPHCKFELNTIKDVPQIVEPDRFEVYKVVHGVDYAGGGFAVVGNLGFSFAGRSNTNGPSPEPYATILYLRSVKNPDARVMTCQHWEDPTDARHLTIDEIRKALGNIFTLVLMQ
jgi:hypothetical protein